MLERSSIYVNKLTIALSLSLVFILLYILFYYTDSGNTDNETNTYASCTLVNGSCQFKLHHHSYIMTLSPANPKPESEITISIETETNTAFKVTGFLSGKNMYMGKIPLFFKPKPQNDSVNKLLLSATTPIGSCTEPEMVWLINVLIEDENNGVTNFISEFTVYRD